MPAGLALGLVTAAIAIGFLIRIGMQARRARLYTDECFHAHVAEWIAAHHRLPGVMPELYSGFYDYYPPLLHFLGAIWITLGGVGTLVLLNVVCAALTLGALAFGLPARRADRAGMWAVLLCVAGGALAFDAVRFYVESLLTLLTLLATGFLLRFWDDRRMVNAVCLGAAVGLALLTKQTALAMLPALGVLTVICALRRDRSRARGFAAALGIALLVATPMFVRSLVLFGDPIYPILARNLDRGVYAMNVSHFVLAPGTFLRVALAAAGPLSVVAGLLALALAAVRRRITVETVLLAGIFVASLGALFLPLADPRHIHPFLPVLALLGARAVDAETRARRFGMVVVSVALIGAATIAVVRMPDYRQRLDVAPDLAVAYQAIHDLVPAGGTVLSLWTYDTFFYSRRNATWPIPWGQRTSFGELFLDRNPETFRATLDRVGIGYILLPRWRSNDAWDGVNYSKSFCDCVDSLGARGQLQVLWTSQSLALLGRVP